MTDAPVDDLLVRFHLAHLVHINTHICDKLYPSLQRNWSKRTWLLKGMRDNTLEWFVPFNTQNTPAIYYGSKSIAFAPYTLLCAQIMRHLSSKVAQDTPKLNLRWTL